MKTKEKIGLLLVVLILLVICALVDNADSSTKRETIRQAKEQAEINRLSK